MTKWYLSRTVWFNIVTTVIMVASLGSIVPVDSKILGLVIGVGNVILRVWFTSQPIEKSLT
jgi:hypothetical protein